MRKMLTPPTVNCVFAGGAGEQPLPPPNVVQPPPTVKPPFLSFAVMRPVQNPAEIGEPTHAFVAVAGLVVSCAPVDVKVVVLEELNVAPTVNAVLAEGTEVAGEAMVLQPVGAQPPATVNPPVLLFAVMVPLHAPATICSPTKLFATVVGALVSVAPVAVKVVVADEVNVAPTMNTELLLGLVVQPVPVQLPTVKPPLLSFAVTVAPHEPATTGEPTHAPATVAGLVVSLADVVVNAVLEDEANTGPVASSPLPEMFSPPPPVPSSKK
ncbi:MAG: hypothetical protein E6I33_11300 [Chloroflexi bacterium]|nr:MAG: hypothetical protein E6I33_11300 [Chloroflexota bacterium]